jgi:hypothetical protein
VTRWRKLGRLYAPHPAHPKLATHAANPLAVRLDGDLYRVFFSGRDGANRSSVGCVDIDLRRRKLMRVHERPVFEHGPAGSFHADGVSVGCCYEAHGARYMLFMGWQRPANAHWRGDIGRLAVQADLSLALDPPHAFMGADATDPVSLSYPWVVREGAAYRMWYGSTSTWDAGNGEMLHVIHQATSRDGERWSRMGLAIPYEMGRAQAFSRPSVLPRAGGGYEMWFSYRGRAGSTYRIGYAACTQAEGPWSLAFDAGIGVSESGWDSEMIEYPFVLDHAGERLMLYNGNGYGLTGFGLAVLE